jgi:hypothetical protein
MSEWGTPGKIPPVLSGTAAALPAFEEWNPDGDIHVPLAGVESLYVPTIVRAPPQLPRPEQHPRTPDFEPRGYEAFFVPANTGLPAHQLSFTARSVQVDNYSNQWLFLNAARRWIPPATVGWILVIIPGTSVATFVVQPPGGHAQGTVGAATDPVVTVWHELWLAPMAGVALTV